MKSKLLKLMAGAACLMLLAGCLSTNPGSSSMAYVDIKSGTPARIQEEVVRVFEDDNYQLVREKDGTMVFERESTQRDRVMYGFYDTADLVMRVVVSVEPRRQGGCLVRADVYTVRDGQHEEKLLRMGRRPYQNLLNQVRASLVKADGG
jgi:hypothetical protein